MSIGGDTAHAFTRSGLDWSEKFSAFVEDAKRLSARSALIDGEVVVIDADGRTNFQALQSAIKGAPARLEFYAFDLLECDGEDLTDLPLVARKERLAALQRARRRYPLFRSHCGAGGSAVRQILRRGA